MNKILVVTGGAGFVGANLLEFLIKKTKFQLVSLDNYSSGSKKNHLKNKRIKYIVGNTKNINYLLSKYKKHIHTIFHFGEFARIYQSFRNFDKCYESNSIGTKEVFNYCLKIK